MTPTNVDASEMTLMNESADEMTPTNDANERGRQLTKMMTAMADSATVDAGWDMQRKF